MASAVKPLGPIEHLRIRLADLRQAAVKANAPMLVYLIEMAENEAASMVARAASVQQDNESKSARPGEPERALPEWADRSATSA